MGHTTYLSDRRAEEALVTGHEWVGYSGIRTEVRPLTGSWLYRAWHEGCLLREQTLDRQQAKQVLSMHFYEEMGQESTRSLTARQVRKIYRLREEGYSYEELAQMFGVSYSTVGDVCRGTTYRELYEQHHQEALPL